MKLWTLFVVASLVYGGFFVALDRDTGRRVPILTLPAEEEVYRLGLGPLSLLASEGLFVKTAIFLGNARAPKREAYIDTLAANCETMISLYPEFADPYFYCQAEMTLMGPEYVRQMNGFLAKGIEARPDDFLLWLFKGFNHFHYLGEDEQAAQLFQEIATRNREAKTLGHLAAVLRARSGNLFAGLMALQAMHKLEENEQIKEHYALEIKDYQKALVVYQALAAYEKAQGTMPDRLEVLVPDYLDKLPTFETNYILNYEPPNLSLIRPPLSDDGGEG